MANHKGASKVGGREKGTPNKFTATVKQVLTDTFNELQNDKEVNLKKWGKDNPTEFYKLCAKLIPAAVDVTTQGEKITTEIKVIRG